ncbi:hypothetical protein GCM10010341_75760 [Streptomyces noursei]|nr:hypothetical protein GCM10010341_75760 [Streptomyces noursei]
MRNRPFVDGFAVPPSSATPALPAQSPRWSCTRNCTPEKPESAISWRAFCSSGRSCGAAAFGRVPAAAAIPYVAAPASSVPASVVTTARRTSRGVRARWFRVALEGDCMVPRLSAAPRPRSLKR